MRNAILAHGFITLTYPCLPLVFSVRWCFFMCRMVRFLFELSLKLFFGMPPTELANPSCLLQVWNLKQIVTLVLYINQFIFGGINRMKISATLYIPMRWIGKNDFCYRIISHFIHFEQITMGGYKVTTNYKHLLICWLVFILVAFLLECFYLCLFSALN